MADKLVLIIEDNEKNRKLARDVLQAKGYATVDTDTAEEGIRIARERMPSLILMDLQLPGIDGIEALGRLRRDSRTRDIPVIAVTASVMTEDHRRIVSAGFDGLQTKPIRIRDFLQAVDDAVARPGKKPA